MSLSSYTGSLKLILIVISLAALLSSCVTRPFVPVNVGREYGNPTTPWVVSHLPEKNKWHWHEQSHTTFFNNYCVLITPAAK